MSLTQPPYFVELLARDQEVKARYRFDTLPIRIGRGYQNDLILDDPYADVHHAIIEMADTGALLIRDLSSENGLTHNGQRIKESELDDALIRLGRTQIRVRHAGFAVEKALLDKSSFNWEGWSGGLVGLTMIILSSLMTVWLSTAERFSYITALTAVAVVLLLALIWCGGWAFSTRTITHGASRFGRHIFIVGCAVVLSDLWDVLSILFAYAFSLEFLVMYGGHVAMAIIAGMLFYHLVTINPSQVKKLKMVCIGLSVIGSSFLLISNYQHNGKLGSSLYMPYLLPPALRLTSNQPIDTFLQEAKSLKPTLEEMRLKPANTGGGVFDD